MSSKVDLSQMEAQLGAERRKVDVAAHNFSVRELIRMVTDDELRLAPAYQRKFRWRNENESLFVESILLGLPIPPLFVATNVGFEWEIVDGLQRISTLIHFTAESDVIPRYVNKMGPLRLTGLEKLSELNGLTFEDFPKNLRVYFLRQPLQVISLTDKSDLQVRFDVFERLNRGAVALSKQEVRACVYQGEFNTFLDQMAENQDLNGLLKLQQLRQHDGTTAEQVLKFFAYKNARVHFDGKVEKFLNSYMADATKHFSYAVEQQIFEAAARRLHEICGGYFLRPHLSLTPLVQFEACLVAVGELLQSGVEVVEPPAGWLVDEELKAASTGGTNTKSMLTRRIDRAKVLLSGSA